MLSATEDRIYDVESWLAPLALGLTPAQFVRLRALLGRPGQTFDPDHTWHVVAFDEGATHAEIRSAVEQVALTIFRLWDTEALLSDADSAALSLRERTGR